MSDGSRSVTFSSSGSRLPFLLASLPSCRRICLLLSVGARVSVSAGGEKETTERPSVAFQFSRQASEEEIASQRIIMMIVCSFTVRSLARVYEDACDEESITRPIVV